MVTTYQKYVRYIQEIKRKDSKHSTIQTHQHIRQQENREITENNKNNKKIINKMAVTKYLSIITLNVNGLNASIKRYRMVEWIKNKRTCTYAAYKRHTSD